jgi:glycine/D-amino acid oxidase-like deaminating enzyme
MIFPISEASPITHQGPLPPQTDVVILGGGIAGVMTAWFLVDRGFKVTLCEKGRIAGEQSSRNWGWIRQQGRDFGELPIMMESLRLWQNLSQQLGEGLGFRQDGVAYIARTEAEMTRFDAWATTARGMGVTTKLLTRDGLQDLMPGHKAPWVGALFTPSDARAEPFTAVPLIAKAAAAKGVVIRENCAVRALDISAGRVTGVVTEQGRIACDQVVVAGGAWSALFLRAHGISIPQLSVLASVARTAPMEQIFAGNAADDRIAFRRREDGGYSIARSGAHDFLIGPDAFRHLFAYVPTLRNDYKSTHFHPAAPRHYPDAWTTPRRWDADRPSPFEAIRVLNPAPNMGLLNEVVTEFAAAFPAARRPQIAASWAGMIDTMPDVVPVLDHAPQVPGLIIATGLSGHGFGIGPGVGRVLADLVADRATGHDLTRFRATRFSDGSRLQMPPKL